MTEFLGTDGGQIAGEVTGLTAAAEEVVAARPELVWTWLQTFPGSVGGARNASGRPGSGSPASRSPVRLLAGLT